jgi:hypothetical protein
MRHENNAVQLSVQMSSDDSEELFMALNVGQVSNPKPRESQPDRISANRLSAKAQTSR